MVRMNYTKLANEAMDTHLEWMDLIDYAEQNGMKRVLSVLQKNAEEAKVEC